jgi:hypothetical protein
MGTTVGTCRALGRRVTFCLSSESRRFHPFSKFQPCHCVAIPHTGRVPSRIERSSPCLEPSNVVCLFILSSYLLFSFAHDSCPSGFQSLIQGTTRVNIPTFSSLKCPLKAFTHLRWGLITPCDGRTTDSSCGCSEATFSSSDSAAIAIYPLMLRQQIHTIVSML